MTTTTGNEVCDLLFLVDATYSMNDYLESLRTSLPQIIAISSLTDCFDRIGVLAYRDYADPNVLEWSGWLRPSSREADQPDIVRMVQGLKTGKGGDWPEATKTGLARAYELMNDDAKTVIIHYADAPPHTLANGDMRGTKSNLKQEQEALQDKSSFGGFGPSFTDWVNVAHMLKRAQVFSILQQGKNNFAYLAYYNYLAAMTGGACIYTSTSSSSSISLITVELLLAWMGLSKARAEDIELEAIYTRYIKSKNLATLKDESDPLANSFFVTPSFSARNSVGNKNIAQVKLTSAILKKYLPKKATPVQSFGARYKADDHYKRIAVEQLRKIIAADVSSVTLNPVFGSLWRSVCNDRLNPAREELIALFIRQVDGITVQDERTRMKTWLEESYDFSMEVQEILKSVSEKQQFPCVCLDPTLVFTQDTQDVKCDGEDDELRKPITSFHRDELLEIGRSCDMKILRRLGKVLTRLTYIKTANEMPAHLASSAEVIRIPVALAEPEHKRQFWRILLHIVVPGTVLSGRPAALLAALSIRIGMTPLLKAADEELSLWRDRWNDIQVPETWNIGCLTLLLDADEAYRARHANGTGLLKDGDKSLFQQLVNYKMLEHNLETTLTAKLGWAPEKTRVPIGPVAICNSCEYPRSITIMGPKGKCGHCLDTQYQTLDELQLRLSTQASKEDDENSAKTWVECHNRKCRAQYVVYCTNNLNCRPKCHFCRQGKRAPVLECSQCLNRIIWPLQYRPTDMDVKTFKCYACNSGCKTIVEFETTAKMISKENSIMWIINNNDKIKSPFNKQSLFKTITSLNGGLDDFCEKVEMFPKVEAVTSRGKQIQNLPELTDELRSWITSRKVEQGVCSLCFDSKSKSEIRPACGRKGCKQTICLDCLENWYGLNKAGKILNIAALCCPFCRRASTASTLSKYGMGIHAVAGLRTAVKDSGTWISAWCIACDYAGKYIQRVCAAGAPSEVHNWHCEICNEGRGRTIVIKKCPGCEVPTERVSGCGHMRCYCGVHWCWFCGEKSSNENIYRHMSVAHGGFYGD